MARRMVISGGGVRDLFAQLAQERVSAAQRFMRAVIALWGLPQTLVGALMCWIIRRNRHGHYRCAIVTEWGIESGLSLGVFIFVPRRCSRALLVHEYGHTMQSLLLGPLYLPLVVLPSLVWAGSPKLRSFRARRGYSYYRFFTERWANRLAARVTGERPAGWR